MPPVEGGRTGHGATLRHALRHAAPRPATPRPRAAGAAGAEATALGGLAALRVDIGVAVLAFALYANTLGAGFVYDDSRAVLRNADATGTSPSWLSAFGNDFWGTPLSHSGSHGSYRPLAVLSLRINALLAPGPVQDHPAGFHLANVILHAAASLLVLRLGRRLLPSRWAASVSAMLFAAHPVHCEAVAGVVGRADLLCAVFSLMSLLAYVRYVDWRDLHRCTHPAAPAAQQASPPASKDLINVVLDQILHPPVSTKSRPESAGGPCSSCCGWSAVLLGSSLALAVCATLSKEPGITVLGVCFVYEAVVQLRRARRDVASLLVLVACGGILLAARLWLMGLRAPRFATADNPAAHSPSLVTRTLTFLHLPVVNAGLLLWPHRLSFDWSMDAVPRVETFADPRNALSVALYAALWRCGSAAWRGLRRGKQPHAKPRDADANNNDITTKSTTAACRYPRRVSLSRTEAVLAALSLLVLPMIPASNLFFYVGFVVAERVLYLPSVGFCLLVALGATVLRHHHRGASRALVALTLLALAARTVLRNADWHDEEALYRSGIAVNPPKAYGNLGSVLSALNRADEAEHAYRMALRHRPNMAEVHYNLGNLLSSRKKYEAAADSYLSAIKYRPTLALAYVNLGHILAKQGRVEDASQVFRECALIPPTGLKDPVGHESARASALLHLAHIEVGLGNLAEAKRALSLAMRIKPAQYQTGPILKLMAEVDEGLRVTTDTRKEAKKVVLEGDAQHALTSADGPNTSLLNESRCATSDNHRRLLSHS